jgi:prophage antirepressor-like protein
MSAHASTNVVLSFENTEFDAVDLHNVPWLRGSQVASALGSSNPTRYISELFDRNADEFTDEMTQVIDLPTAGGIQPVRIFSPRGCYLLGMLARTEKAKAFRAWVLDVLEGRAVPRESKPMTIPQTIAMHRLRLSLLKELKGETASGMRIALHGQVSHVSRLLAMPVPALDSIGRTVVQPELPGV